MRIRTVFRAAVVTISASFVLLIASPAFARIQDDGAEPGRGLSGLETFLIFVAAPVGAFLLITLLVMAPSIARGPRYRADQRWDARPQIFGVEQTADVTASASDEPAEEGGSASARW